MSRSGAIKSNLADDPMGREWDESSPRSRRSSKRAGEGADGADAVSIFESGISKMGPQKVAAVDLDMSESHLADHLRGERTIAFHRVVRICRRNPDAALVMLTELSRIAGLAPPQRPRKVSKREVQEATTRKVRSILQLWQIVRADVAADLETTTEDAEAALDEVSEVRSFSR